MARGQTPDGVDAPIYRLKVSLKGTKPSVWRRIEVEGDTTLHRLHRVLQVVMGWKDYHLYEFMLDGRHFLEPDPDYGPGVENSRRMRLNQIVAETKRRLTYIYDFGDGWQHDVLVERVLPAEEGVRYPHCTGGRMACPPEDCGGLGGYGNLLEVIGDPEDPGYDEMMEWLGGSYDPEAFDLEGVNERLRRMR